MGNISLELYWDHAPKTCKNFSELAKRGYYNGVIFHRIIADFMAQSGDPTGTGRGGTSIYGQKFEDEISPELRFVGAGILAMANSGPNTNGSQFFLTLAPTPYLDGKHTIFGRVSSGMRVLQRVGAVATDAQDSGLGPESDYSSLSSAPPSPPSSRPSSPAPLASISVAPPPFGRSKRRKPAAGLGASSTSTSTLPNAKPLRATPPPNTAPTLPKKRTYKQRQRSTQLAKASTSEETPTSTEDEQERRKPRKRRAQPKPKSEISQPKSRVEPKLKTDPSQPKSKSELSQPKPSVDAPSSNPDVTNPPRREKGAHRPRPSTSKIPIFAPAPPRPEPTPLANLKKLEARQSSFLTKSVLSAPGLYIPNVKPRTDVWSYAELDGLVWVKLDLEGANESPKIAGDDQTAGRLCWWPAQVTERTPNYLKLTLCGPPPNPIITSTPPLELLPSSLSESNILTFRYPSSVRFPTFKAAFSSQQSPNQPESEEPPDEKLEIAWKTACTRAFEIDAEKNDGLEDIFLLFSQKTRSERDESVQGSVLDPVEAEDEGYRTDEGDILEVDSVVLCRYRTRYYPAKVCEYYPRGERGPRGKYMCRFADDSTRLAPRHEIHTQLDPGFVKCPLGQYTQKASTYPGQSWIGRPPTPEPRASSPEPPESRSTIDTAEYCALERMRDQLKPVLPFLQGIISRTYVPGRGTEQADEPLDRHAAYMQGGRTRKSLAFSVHTGDLNEDDCEALMYEVSRWALRGERWAERLEKPEDVESGVSGAVPAIVVDATAVLETSRPVDEVPAGPSATNEDPPSTQATDVQDSKMVVDSQPADLGTLAATQTAGDTEMRDLTMETQGTNGPEANSKEVREDNGPVEGRSTPDTIAEDVGLVRPRQQPPRPVGGPEYERLAPGERMGYVSDVLYPEAAAFILSYRRGIRTQVGPLSDPQAELNLYNAGIQAAKNTVGKEDWVDKILATRQLREAASYRNGPNENSEQVIISGGTRSRPKYVPSKSVLKS
ncbi:peptidyl-prolyl cis-trans isomerase, cyclophilin-type protein [Ceratobasidium sp. AG-Ba]|nr:peptidyl-prolyl cis-trans isomerase, cyclophilin-type protein [Ceratobasidium sp. AG-Ba]